MQSLFKLFWRWKVRSANSRFDRTSFLDAYAEHTDALVMYDEKMGIGGLWDEMGKKQFEFLREKGLTKDSKLLDIGCGTLRGGRYFIAYLNKGNYYGFDISRNAIRKAWEVVDREGLREKVPNLQVNEKKTLTFDQYEDYRFDYILAQSVFSHLLPEHIEETFSYVTRIMDKESKFFFTFHRGDEYLQRGKKDFEYPCNFFQRLAEENDLDYVDLSNEYGHPRGQAMACVTLRAEKGSG